MSSTEGPDCLCVGLARAGTGWLYRQLRDHPDFWMPPIKEIDYLDRPVPSLPDAFERLARIEASARPARDERNRVFIRELASLAGKARDLDAYAALFRLKGEQKSGDITPSYARLDEALIRRIAARMPGIGVVLLIRDPVERAWSRIGMQQRHRRIDASVVREGGAMADFLRQSETFGDPSRPTRVIALWKRAAPQIPFRHFFFDDLLIRPAWLRAEILTFLGVDPERSRGTSPPADNNKAGTNAKLPLEGGVKEALVAHYRSELLACAEAFGDYGRGWAARYGL
jgi:hypothetical protein